MLSLYTISIVNHLLVNPSTNESLKSISLEYNNIIYKLNAFTNKMRQYSINIQINFNRGAPLVITPTL